SGKLVASGGTRASTGGAVASKSFAFRDGALRTERGAKQIRSFAVDVSKREGISVGSSEHFTLPRSAPQLREVNAYLGWFGQLARPMQVLSIGFSAPGGSLVLNELGGRFVSGAHRRH